MTEIILIVIIFLVTIGLGKLPKLASSLGRMRSNFKQGLAGAPDVVGAPIPNDATRKPGKFEHRVEDADLEGKA